MRRFLTLVFLFSLPLFAVTATLDKTAYLPGEEISITLSDMPGNEGDWLGIFPAESEDDWANIVDGIHDGTLKDGTFIIYGVPEPGDYELRVFLDNSYQRLAVVPFKVTEPDYHVNVTTSKSTYQELEPITVTLSGMPGNPGDWVGIFPKGSENVWDNVLSWKFDGHVVDGTYDLDPVPEGEYEVRVFLNNSYHLLAKAEFRVEKAAYHVDVTTSKQQFEVGEPITVTLSGMPGNPGDWVGIFPKGSENVWDNVLTWKFDGHVVDGTYDLDPVPEGEYEVRVFLNNSYRLLAQQAFSVTPKTLHPTLKTKKEEYLAGEKITVEYTNMLGNSQDWIGIFPKDSNDDFDNVVIWKRTDGEKAGSVTLSGIAAGEYEIRAFFSDSNLSKATLPLKVSPRKLDPMVLEDGEDGTTDGWVTLEGSKRVANRTLYGNHVIYIPHHWHRVNGNWVNDTLYELRRPNGDYWDNAVQKVLKADIHPYHSWGSAACYNFGVRVMTLHGERLIFFSTWYGNKHFKPTWTKYSDDWIELVFPITKDLVFKNKWQKVDLDLEEYLKQLEPENRILTVRSFLTTGGNYIIDNLRLEEK